MPNTYTTLSSLFTAIANAIRTKTGSSAQIVADNFPTEIANIQTGIDPSDATAVAGDIVAPKTAYISTGKVTGQMANNGAVSQTLDTQTTAYTIPQGYHNGQGSVSVSTQTKSVTPTTNAQTVSADSGKVLESVSVGAIQTQTKSATPSGTAQTITPDSGKYLSQVAVDAVTKNSGIGQTLYNQGVSDTKVGTAGTGDVLSGKTFTNSTTVGANGGMTNRGAWTASVTPSSSAQTVTIPQGYHNGSGYVSVGASSGGVSQATLVVDEHIDYLQSYTPTLTNGKSYFVLINLKVSMSRQGSLAFIVGSTQSIGSTGIYKMQGTTNPTFTTTNSSGSGLKIYELS